ncbi:shikimate/quinate 5-dehydrogenase [Dactylonectria estremocensis]|uniref:Shikimate/quinate 5-dehydrogenase n=1 Tax=Dactylonectria estremocensis TaxID=1079267 RepID=A0A9P9ES30_9HYPO|nr:shikimate/quinate 5-dehydrogenase [Dactylonectria estremocensis]
MSKSLRKGFGILSDRDVKNLLVNLGKNDVSSFANTLQMAFQSYSIGKESQYQPHRQGVTRPNGQTTLFMPATLADGVSVKVVGVPAPQRSGSAGLAPPLRGVLVLCDDEGKCIGILNSEEFTAFRTSLGSISLYQYRRKTDHIVVFGAGKQALWHLRLALVLRSLDIKTVTIINRSAERAIQLINRLREMDGESTVKVAQSASLHILDSDSLPQEEFQDRTRAAIQRADAIFCTTPTKKPLFPAEWLMGDQGRQKTRYISAIGSYNLDMSELDPELLRLTSATTFGTHHPTQGGNVKGLPIVVDSREACALESGEIVQAQLPAKNLVEVGELVDLQTNGSENAQTSLKTWLEEGPVIYKSVGVGIMDLALGQALIGLAKDRGVGTWLEEF